MIVHITAELQEGYQVTCTLQKLLLLVSSFLLMRRLDGRKNVEYNQYITVNTAFF